MKRILFSEKEMQRTPLLLRKIGQISESVDQHGCKLSNQLQHTTAWRSVAAFWKRQAATGSTSDAGRQKVQLIFEGPYVVSHGRSSGASSR